LQRYDVLQPVLSLAGLAVLLLAVAIHCCPREGTVMRARVGDCLVVPPDDVHLEQHPYRPDEEAGGR
jgi:hypothetical protein